VKQLIAIVAGITSLVVWCIGLVCALFVLAVVGQVLWEAFGTIRRLFIGT
jgi:hypothetical protein